MLIYAKFARNCYFKTVGDDKALQIFLCSLARLELDYLTVMVSWEIPDLVLEFSKLHLSYEYEKCMNRFFIAASFAKVSFLCDLIVSMPIFLDMSTRSLQLVQSTAF